MKNLELILKEMESVVSNPINNIERYKKENNMKSIGCFPIYCPEEIIHAAGMFPVGIWGGQTSLDYAGQYFPAFACSIMQSCLEMGLKGVYDKLSGVIIPGMCDTLICMAENWKSGIPHIPCINLVHPQNRKIEAGIKYLMSEYESIKNRLEEISGVIVTDQRLEKSIEVYNNHRKIMREFSDLAATHSNTISPYKRNLIIKSGFFMLKEEHSKLVEEVISILKKLPNEEFKGSRVLLTGILADSKEFLDLLEEHSISVVADDLAQESRQFRTDVPSGETPMRRLAMQWSNIEGCSLAYDPKKQRGELIAKEAKAKNADAVIFCMMKFCDPEEYDYPIVKKDIEDAGLKTLYVEIDQQSESSHQIRTRIQGFSEMIMMV